MLLNGKLTGATHNKTSPPPAHYNGARTDKHEVTVNNESAYSLESCPRAP